MGIALRGKSSAPSFKGKAVGAAYRGKVVYAGILAKFTITAGRWTPRFMVGTNLYGYTTSSPIGVVGSITGDKAVDGHAMIWTYTYFPTGATKTEYNIAFNGGGLPLAISAISIDGVKHTLTKLPPNTINTQFKCEVAGDHRFTVGRAYNIILYR